MHGEKRVLFSLECFGVNVIPSYECYEVVIVVISEKKHRTQEIRRIKTSSVGISGNVINKICQMRFPICQKGLIFPN